MNFCTIESCGKTYYARGWCRMHYRILSEENKKRWQKVKKDSTLRQKAKEANKNWYEKVKNTEKYKEFNRKRSHNYYHKSEFRKKYLYQWKENLSEDKKKEYQKKDNFYGHRRRAQKTNNGGTHTLKEWEDLKRFYNYMCLCCKRFEPEIKLTEDHIIPLNKHGTDDINNIQPLCYSCNCRKFTQIKDYRPK